MRDGKTIGRAKRLRSEMSGYEIRLWSFLRDRRFNAKFRRQHAIGPYVVDFACVDARLVIELDGPSHTMDEQIAFDELRTAFLERAGWRVLRIKNEAVMENIAVVGDRIAKALSEPRKDARYE